MTPYSFTINTDASHHPQTKVSAWACWIKSSHYKMRDAGLLEGGAANSSVAELMAVEQALILLDNLIATQPFLQSRTEPIKLYINTDSIWAIQALSGNMKRSKHIEIAKRIRALTDGFEIEVRHVKAHTNTDDARSWVNSWCDRAARKLVRARVEELNDRTT
jgi:ribonuclease HI